MTDDPVTQALAELQDLVRCRCHPAYTGRNLRDPDCNCDDAEAVEIVADRIEAQAAEIERLRSYLERIEKVSEFFTNPEHSELTLRYAHESTQRLAKEALTGSTTVKDSLTTEDEKQSHEWKCPIDYPGCRKNCGSYGCGN